MESLENLGIYNEIGNHRTKMYRMIRKYEASIPIEQEMWEKNPNKITWDKLTPHDYGDLLKDIGI